MKNIKIIIVILICITIQQKIIAQGPVQGSYVTNNTMSVFHGTWQWVNGTDTVKLFLDTKKVYCDVNGGFYWDLLVGWHLYKKGNVIIENSLPYINNVGLRTFTGSNQNSSTAYKIEDATFKDISKNKECELTLILNAAQNQLTWRLTEHKGMRIYGNGHTAPPAGLTLPRNIVLTKL